MGCRDGKTLDTKSLHQNQDYLNYIWWEGRLKNEKIKENKEDASTEVFCCGKAPSAAAFMGEMPILYKFSHAFISSHQEPYITLSEVTQDAEYRRNISAQQMMQ